MENMLSEYRVIEELFQFLHRVIIWKPCLYYFIIFYLKKSRYEGASNFGYKK